MEIGVGSPGLGKLLVAQQILDQQHQISSVHLAVCIDIAQQRIWLLGRGNSSCHRLLAVRLSAGDQHAVLVYRNAVRNDILAHVFQQVRVGIVVGSVPASLVIRENQSQHQFALVLSLGDRHGNTAVRIGHFNIVDVVLVVLHFRDLCRRVVVVHLRLIAVYPHDYIAGLEASVDDFGQIHVIPIGQVVLDPCRPCRVVGQLETQRHAAGSFRQLGFHIEFLVPRFRFRKIRIRCAAVGFGHLAQQCRETGVVVARYLVVDVVLPVVLVGTVLVGAAHQCSV